VLDDTQSAGLKHQNVAGGQNDTLIEAVYSADDIAKLRRLSESNG
jgi:hypothetical protein